MKYFLQIDAVNTAMQLTNYGPLGIMVILFISVIIYLEKVRRASEAEVRKIIDEQRKEISLLKDRFDKYQNEDRSRMLEIIQHNTDVMEEVVTRLETTRKH